MEFSRIQKRLNIFFGSGDKIVNNKHTIIPGQVFFAEMGADKTRSPCDKNIHR